MRKSDFQFSIHFLFVSLSWGYQWT
jgi:hypothetical protein